MSNKKHLAVLCLDALSVAHEAIVSLGEKGTDRALQRRNTDITTKGDLQVSKRLMDLFRERGIPAILYSEEAGRTALTSKPEYTICFDDIDGTDNYFRGRMLLPHCTVVTLFDTPEPRFTDAAAAGVIEHRSGAVWHAVRGGGCFLDGSNVQTSGKTVPDRETLVTIDHYASRSEICRLRILYDTCWVKDYGSAALHLAGISSGLFDGYASFSQKAHELGAGYLLVKEAGGCVKGMDGSLLDDLPYDFDEKYGIVAGATVQLCDTLLSDMVSREGM